MPPMADREYVLGTGADELERLDLQNRLWSDVAVRSWRRAKLRPGQRVLDVGCGPGYAACELAHLVGHAGTVVGVDESTGFVAHANQLAAARGLPQLTAQVGDVQALGDAVATDSVDLAYARWVLCFVADPDAVLAGIAAVLRPGAHLVVHDYFAYASMTLAPRSRHHDLAVAATVRSWQAGGGDPDIGGRMPAMLRAHGFELEHVEAHVRVARGDDTMFAWPDTWWRTFAPKLVAMGELEQATCDALLDDLAAIAHGEGFVQCPPVYEFVATRRG